MSEANGNANGKAFVLAPPKSAEEIASEERRSLMPKLRRGCSKDARLKNSVGAKWLFSQLTDDSFLNNYGGDGKGRVYLSLKDLRRIYGHDEGTLARWRDKLVETGWIWFQESWPKSCWGIMGVCQQPELFPPHADYVRVMARASGQEHQNSQPHPAAPPSENGKTANYGQNDRTMPADQPQDAASVTASCGQTNRILRSHQPHPAVSVGGAMRSDHPQDALTPTASCGLVDRNSRVTPPAADSHIQESPRENGASESLEPTLSAQRGVSALKKKGGEDGFLREVAATLTNWSQKGTAKEMNERGGWWRNRFRESPDKAWRVLAEIGNAIKEGKVKEHPGKMAFDLWERWPAPLTPLTKAQ